MEIRKPIGNISETKCIKMKIVIYFPSTTPQPSSNMANSLVF